MVIHFFRYSERVRYFLYLLSVFSCRLVIQNVLCSLNRSECPDNSSALEKKKKMNKMVTFSDELCSRTE